MFPRSGSSCAIIDRRCQGGAIGEMTLLILAYILNAAHSDDNTGVRRASASRCHACLSQPIRSLLLFGTERFWP